MTEFSVELVRTVASSEVVLFSVLFFVFLRQFFAIFKFFLLMFLACVVLQVLVGREVVHSCLNTHAFVLYLMIIVLMCVRYTFKFLFASFLVLMVAFVALFLHKFLLYLA